MPGPGVSWMTARRVAAGACRCALSVLLVACSQDDVVATRRCGTSPCPVGDPAFCAGSGPQISAAQDSSLCAGSLIARLLPVAVCSCGFMQGGDVVSDSFDSSVASYQPGGRLGDVAVSGPLHSEGSWLVNGSLVATDPSGVTVRSTLRTQGSLQVQGPLSGDSVAVQGDAQVGSNIQLVNLVVAGTLTTPAGSSVQVSGQSQITSSAQQAVQVAMPCPCDLDPYVTAPINELRARNDNAALALRSEQLEGFAGDALIDLPCGRYFFSRIAGLGGLQLRIHGRVELAVSGGIDLGGAWTVSLDPGAELDLYVHGDVTVAGPLSLGDPSAPPRFRWFPGGVDSLSFSGGGSISAALLGRRRAWMSSAPIDLYGALIVDSLQTNAGLRVHRDRAVSGLAGQCRLP